MALNDRPRAYVGEYTAQNQCIEFHGLPEREECADDI